MKGVLGSREDFVALTALPVAFGDLMALRSLGESTFRSPAYRQFPAERAFGGQLVAQALWAAGRLAPAGLLPHSLHAYFLRPVGSSMAVDYHVTTLKQGRNLSAFRVEAAQGDRMVFTMSASFESGHDGRLAAAGEPSLAGMPGPDDCWCDPAYAGAPLATFPATSSFDVRFARPPSEGPRAFHPCWVRSKRDLSGDPLLNACALAFVSDMGVLSGCVPAADAALAYGGASLDHDVRFGQVTRLDDWHIFDFRPLLRVGSRGLGHGCLRTADGTVAAVVAQEGFFPGITTATQPTGQ